MTRLQAARSGLRSTALSFTVSFVVVAVALAIGLLLVAITGASAGDAAKAMWEGAFGGTRQIGATLADTVVLTILALAWCVAFSGFRINVGMEGQALMGGTAAAFVGLHLGLPSPFPLLGGIVAAIVVGAAWAGIAAWLWAKRHVNEIITTLLLNLVAVQVLSWLIRGPLKDPDAAFPQTAALGDAARFPNFLSGSVLTWTIVFIPLFVLGVWFLLRRTTFGYSLRMTGANPEVARAGGIKPLRVGVIALMLSGAMAGIAGACLTLGGESTVVTDNFTAGVGFEAIAVALLARNRPLACVPAALLFAFLEEGGGLMEARVGVSSSLVDVCQGLVIVFVAGSAFYFERHQARAAGSSDELHGDIDDPLAQEVLRGTV